MDQQKEYMKIALEEAKQALEAGEFPVGCILVQQGRIVSRGRRENSIPFVDTPGPFQSNELDHAEMIALRNIDARNLDLNGEGLVAYTTLEPCLMCYSAFLLSNVRTIVFAYEDVMGGGTTLNMNQLSPLYRKMRIAVIPDVMRKESLRLFKQFFVSPDNLYWRDSLLARYTLAQPD